MEFTPGTSPVQFRRHSTLNASFVFSSKPVMLRHFFQKGSSGNTSASILSQGILCSGAHSLGLSTNKIRPNETRANTCIHSGMSTEAFAVLRPRAAERRKRLISLLPAFHRSHFDEADVRSEERR